MGVDERDAVQLIIPFFEEGGRYTINDVHYAAEGDWLVPAAETPFAKDASFGYTRSNLREWIEEKTRGDVKANTVHSIGLNEIRQGGPERVKQLLMQIPARGVAVVNAASMRDMAVVVAGLLDAEAAGHRFLCRTAASFVCVRAGLAKRPLLTAQELRAKGRDVSRGSSGLIIVGSYVPKTTEQLERLLEATPQLEQVELHVSRLRDISERKIEIASAAARINHSLGDGRDAVLFTSRQLVTGTDAKASLEVGRLVSDALVETVRRVVSPPRFFVAKGGITSSDVATKSLDVKRAIVLGQILPGIPVWRLGEESRFPGMNYVVFPGNVGGPDALLEAHRKLAP